MRTYLKSIFWLIVFSQSVCASQYDGLTSAERETYLGSCLAPPPGKGPGLYATDRKLCWDPGDTLTVEFLDGTPEAAALVLATAAEWSHCANIKFVQCKTGGTIRVSFAQRGFYSQIGRLATSTVGTGQPTMSLGFATAPSDMWRRHILHEFGHALGFAHEHQSPDVTIQWDREKVIKFFQSQGPQWTLQNIESNVLSPLPSKNGTWTKFDPLSIMLYPVPSTLTRNHVSYGLNKELSALDKSKASELYPR